MLMWIVVEGGEVWGTGENPPVVMQMSLYERELVDHFLPQRLPRTSINIRRDRNRPAAQKTRTPNNTPYERLEKYINKITAEQSQGQKGEQDYESRQLFLRTMKFAHRVK